MEKYDREYLIALCQQKFYELQIKDLKNEISKVASELEEYNFDKKMKEYTVLSTKIFKSKLAERYSKQERKEWKIDELQTESKNFIKDYPVVLSTTCQLYFLLQNCYLKQQQHFHYA